MTEHSRKRHHGFVPEKPGDISREQVINIAAARRFCTSSKPPGVNIQTHPHSSQGDDWSCENKIAASGSLESSKPVKTKYPPPRNLQKYVVRRDFPVGLSNPNGSPKINVVGASENLKGKGIVISAETKNVVNAPTGNYGMGNPQKASGSNERKKVLETLNLFQEKYTELLRERMRHQEMSKNFLRKLPMETAIFLKGQRKWINATRQIGEIGGVNTGDSFQFRAELSVIGLHIPYQRGIDYSTQVGIVLATSIVDNGCYNNHRESRDILIYSGEGGRPKSRGEVPEDQKLERGNLALKNSCLHKRPVRVISYTKVSKFTRSIGPSLASKGNGYVYDGLYQVNKWWEEQGKSGNIVFNFELSRISEQHKPTNAGVQVNS